MEEPWEIRCCQPDLRVPFTHAPSSSSPLFFEGPRGRRCPKRRKSFRVESPVEIFQTFWYFLYFFSPNGGLRMVLWWYYIYVYIYNIYYLYIYIYTYCYGILGNVSKFWRPYKSCFFVYEGIIKDHQWCLSFRCFGAPNFWTPTYLGTNISHLGKGKIIFKSALKWDMLVFWRVFPTNTI